LCRVHSTQHEHKHSYAPATPTRLTRSVYARRQSINQSKVLTKPHAGKREATSQHHHRGQQTLHHEREAITFSVSLPCAPPLSPLGYELGVNPTCWPSHDIAMTNIAWCLAAHKGGVGRGGKHTLRDIVWEKYNEGELHEAFWANIRMD